MHKLLAILIVSVVLATGSVWYKASALRTLHGEEKDAAVSAFNAAFDADMYAEIFSDPTIPDLKVAFADSEIKRLRTVVSTKPGWHVVTLLEYYVQNIKKLATVDKQCAALRFTIPQANYDALSPLEKASETTPYEQCISRRYDLEQVTKACRQEVVSYVRFLTPPLDSCVFRTEHPNIERKNDKDLKTIKQLLENDKTAK